MKQWFCCLMLLLLFTSSLVHADTLSLTTYYPAPFGAYSLLRLNPTTDASMGACDGTKTGQMYFSSDSGEIKVCSGTAWSSTGPWTLNVSGKYVYQQHSTTDTAYRIGIGIAAPTARLHVKGIDDATNGQLRIESTQSDAKFTLYNSSGASATGNASMLMSNTAGSEGLRFMINNTDKMILDENGNVGVGMTAPNTNLHVTGADNATYGQFEIQSTGADARLSLYNSAGASPTGRGDILMSRTAGSEGLRFAINGATKMTLDETGNLGIGLTAPTSVLHISRGALTDPAYLAKFESLSIVDDTSITSSIICRGTGNSCVPSNADFQGMDLFSAGATYLTSVSAPNGAGFTSQVILQNGTQQTLIAEPTKITTSNNVNVGIGVNPASYKLQVNGPIGGALENGYPASSGILKVDCHSNPGNCYAVYAP